MSHQYATLEDTVYLYFASNDTSGSGGDGASAAAHVRLAGAAAGAAPVLSPSPTLLSHASYPAGAYEVAVAATAVNGFASGKTYGVFCTLAVDSQNPTGFIGSIRTDTVPADAVAISGDTTAANNAELAFDGTGYGFTNCTVPTVTTLTGHTPQTGDSYALANGATGFAAIDTVVDGIQTDLSNGTDGLGALKILIDAVKAETALIVADTDVIDDGTSGLVKIASDVAAILVDTGTTLDGRIPAALVSGRMSSDVGSISGSTDGADKLEASAETMLIGTVSHDNSAATTTVFYCDDITEATADHFNGRIVIFTSGALIRQATDITDYELAAGEGKFTVTALTEAPADNVTFIIV